MIDFTTDLGTRALQRLQTEFIIWLTTVDAAGVAQPRPVWFIWENDAFLIYSQPNTKKLQHITQHPQVSLHFNGGQAGEDIQVFSGPVEVVANPIPVHQSPAYLQKYAAAIKAMGATAEKFASSYSVLLRIPPTRLRGMVP
jgi:PPOX class probable F420-dependent enzyme